MAERTERLIRRAGVVDDHPVNRLVGNLTLQALGFEVCNNLYHDDPEERAKLVIESSADLILLDGQMPNEDGPGLIGRLIGKLRTELLVIIATAEGNPREIHEKCLTNAQGDPRITICSRLLPKPFNHDDLESVLGLSEESSQTAENHEQPPTAQELVDQITYLLKDAPDIEKTEVQNLLTNIHRLWQEFVDHPGETNVKERMFCHVIKNAALNISGRLNKMSSSDLQLALLEMQSLLKAGDSTQNMTVKKTNCIRSHGKVVDLFKGENRLKIGKPVDGIWIQHHEWELAIAIANLVSNALKAGVGASEVSVEYHLEGNNLVVRVVDNGNPFPKNFRRTTNPGSTGNGFADIENLGFAIDLSEAYGLKGAWNTFRRWVLGEQKKAISLRIPLIEESSMNSEID